MSESPEPRLDSPALEKDENEEDVTLDKERDIAADISDDESVLSDVDEEQFREFDPADIPLDDRPALAIDEENLKLVGRHKRRRTEEDGEGQTKKKKKEGRRDKKSHRKKQGSEEFSGGEEMDGKRRRKRREGGGEKAPRQSKKQVEEEIDEESLDPATSKLYSSQRKSQQLRIMLTRDFHRATPCFGPDDGRSAEEAFETAYQESRWDRESIFLLFFAWLPLT